LIVWCILCTVLTNSSSSADTQEVGSGSASASSTNNSSGSNSRESTRTKLDPAHFTDKVDWGTFYDPQSIFCGQFDCYKILALNYENGPTTKDITRNYRALGRHWHPDKNKDKGAKERFVVSDVFGLGLIDPSVKRGQVYVMKSYVFIFGNKNMPFTAIFLLMSFWSLWYV
jgi:hypothetical protein